MIPWSHVEIGISWFPGEIADVRTQADEDPDKRVTGDMVKRKVNAFYGKMIDYVARHANTTFTRDDKKVDQALRSQYLENLEKIDDVYEIREGKHKVSINRA